MSVVSLERSVITPTEDQFLDIPLQSLLSSTSGIPERHGELAKVIGGLDVVSCDELSLAANRAMRNYFIESKTPIQVRKEVRKVATGVSQAVSATLKYLRDDSLDSVNVDDYFSDLELRVCEESDKEVDVTIRAVLGRIGLGGHFDHGPDNRTYLFRVATGDPSYDMIAELHRHHLPEQQTPFTKHVDVMYHMSIAGYDAVENLE